MSVVIRLYAEHGIGCYYLDADGHPWASLSSAPYQCELCGRSTVAGYVAGPTDVRLCTRCVTHAGYVLDCPDCGERWLWDGKLPAPSRFPICGACTAIRRHSGRDRRCNGRLRQRPLVDPHRKAGR